MYQGKVYVLLHNIRAEQYVVNHCCDSVVIMIVLFTMFIVVNIQIKFLCSLMMAKNLYFLLTLMVILGCFKYQLTVSLMLFSIFLQAAATYFSNSPHLLMVGWFGRAYRAPFMI